MLSLTRCVVEEIMDRPDVPPSDHARALAGLRRINAVSGCAAQMAKPIIQWARRQNVAHLSMVDIACGGGDVPIAIAKLAAQNGINVHLTLVDRSATALQLASDASKAAGLSIETVQANLFDHWNLRSFDIVTCSLFLHHIATGDGVVELMTRMRSVTKSLVVISDLRRCRTGLCAAWIGGRLFSRSPIVHFDAPASVRAAWTRQELAGFATGAGMQNARIQNCWPWRMLLTFNAEDRVA